MTTLSLLELNLRSRSCRKDMGDPQSMHRRMMGLFPAAHSNHPRREFGVLWRVEPAKTPTLLLQSAIAPDFAYLPNEYASFECKSIDSHLKSLAEGQIIRYRTMINPVRSSRNNEPDRLFPLSFADQPEWWKRRAERIGLAHLDLLEPTLVGYPTKHLRRNEGAAALPLYSTRIDGVAEIVDAKGLRSAIETGVGRAKAWGCGLLTVAHG